MHKNKLNFLPKQYKYIQNASLISLFKMEDEKRVINRILF
ncbi:protein of unknown function [Xenorhabdus bovienii]|uniref:Uncharacterized protein n=1 Tax=Xenorhabdus bovienii TaxID=40576 RepID=A0A0B6X8K7_XENBV|nr:protein of unknown function [Xenorhabdus bovienii]